MFSDDALLICPNKTSLLENLRQTFIWTDSWGMQRNVAKFQHIFLGSGVTPVFNMPNSIDRLSFQPCVEWISDLGIFIDYSMKTSVHVSKAGYAEQNLSLFEPRTIHTNIVGNSPLHL